MSQIPEQRQPRELRNYQPAYDRGSEDGATAAGNSARRNGLLLALAFSLLMWGGFIGLLWVFLT